MSKQPRIIQQSTYDEVIKENVEDLDMTPEEAIQDAELQFKSQGVSLTAIITNPTVIKTETGIQIVHRVTEALKELEQIFTTNSANPYNDKQTISNLKIITEECQKGMAQRGLAARNSAFPLLMDLWKNSGDNQENCKITLNAIAALVNGQPDLFDAKHLQIVIDSLKKEIENEDLCIKLLQILHLACIKHEGNRQTLIEKDVLNPVMQVLRVHGTSLGVIKNACLVLRSLVLDDDVRVEFGRAHENAKFIVQNSGLELLCELLHLQRNCVASASEIVLTLSRLMVRNEFCKEMSDAGIVRHLVQALVDFIDDQFLVRNVLILLKALAGNDLVQKEIVKENGHALIINSTEKHLTKAPVCEAAFAALAMLALRNPPHCAAIVEAGGAQIIIQAMQIHSEEQEVQKQACHAVRNLVARCREHKPTFLDLGAEKLIRDARERYPNIGDDAKAALRDLDCSVELRELWTGQKGSIQA